MSGRQLDRLGSCVQVALRTRLRSWHPHPCQSAFKFDPRSASNFCMPINKLTVLIRTKGLATLGKHDKSAYGGSNVVTSRQHHPA